MIYVDNAATTPISRRVSRAMWPYIMGNYGNPSSIYEYGINNKQVIENVRKTVASTIGAKAEEIFFTSGGTEGDNWVLRNAVSGYSSRDDKYKGHIIVSNIEHHAVLNTCKELINEGYDVDYLKVRNDGIVDVSKLEKLIRHDTVLISVMLVNNEIGTIQPLKEICDIAYGYEISVHTDAVAGYGHIPIDVDMLGVDYLSVSAHKIRGPKGVGFVYARGGKIKPMIYGGGQEMKKRSGTENVAGIVGLGVAAKDAHDTMGERTRIEFRTREYMKSRILKEIPDVIFNGDEIQRVSGNLNFSFKDITAGTLVVMLDKQGICASAGSACSSGDSKPSHVLKAIGLDDSLASGSLRLTIDHNITMKEADYCVNCIKYDVFKLRNLVE